MRLEVVRWNGNGNPPGEDVFRQRLEEEGFDVFHCRDESGTDYQTHSHDSDKSLWVVAGEMVVGAEGSEFSLRPGDRLILPKGTIHTSRAGREGVTYLIGERR